MENYIHKFIYILRPWKKGIFPVSAFIHIGSPAISCEFFLFNIFSQMFPMFIPGNHFTYKHIFRYSDEYASIEKGLRSFELFF